MRKTNKDWSSFCSWGYGTSDDVSFYRKGNFVAALSTNYNSDHAAIDIRNINEPDEIVCNASIQNISDMECLEDFFNLSERRQFELMHRYVEGDY